MMMEQTDCSEMSVHKIQMPGNYPEESIQHSEHVETLKSRNISFTFIQQGICSIDEDELS